MKDEDLGGFLFFPWKEEGEKGKGGRERCEEGVRREVERDRRERWVERGILNFSNRESQTLLGTQQPDGWEPARPLTHFPEVSSGDRR